MDAWALTAAISPRGTVRVAAIDAGGAAVNMYPHLHAVAGSAPARPWAVPLTDLDGRFQLVVADLDAGRGGRSAVARDAEVLGGLLTDAGIPYVVCESGPTGGRHLWVRLAPGEAAEADLVAVLARLAGAVCPTLDRSPLANPATGCVRPPGAPHRHGGASRILAGDVDDVLLRPSATRAQLRHLVELLARQVAVGDATTDSGPTGPLPLDEHGHRHLPGPRRPLPAYAAEALEEDAAAGDASAVLWRFLVGAASARWRYDDVAQLAPTAAGLEHTRTFRDGGRRRPRPTRGPASPYVVLARQWDRAVRHAAAARTGADPTWQARCAQVAAHVQAIQDRADACPRRWLTGGGPSDRRVLDVLCALVLQAVSCDVEADIRRLALAAGIGRETARTALHRLAGDGWIAPKGAATGPRGQVWTLDPQEVIHRSPDPDRSQADPPPGTGPAHRSLLLTRLTGRAESAAHDAFARAGLGLAAGNAYARLREQTRPAPADRDGARAVARLADAGLARPAGGGWRATSPRRRAAVAQKLGTEGTLAERADRYEQERQCWAWWLAELQCMHTPAARTSPRRRPGDGQLTLVHEAGTHSWTAHPRVPGGRADFAGARRRIAAGTARTVAVEVPSTRRPRSAAVA